MNVAGLRCASSCLLLGLFTLTSCGERGPEVVTCMVQEDCPDSQFCLQQVCETTELPEVMVLSPEDETIYPVGDGTPHAQMLTVQANNLTLRPQSESSARVVGEGYLVVFVDEVEVGTIESGDLAAGVQLAIAFEDTPGVHRLRVQARLNDGSDYDHDGGSARVLVWVDDGRDHIALRRPWPGDSFSLESQLTEVELAAIGSISIGAPSTGSQNGKTFYDVPDMAACLMESLCSYQYTGVIPNDEDPFGPMLLPESAGGSVTLSVVASESDHTWYVDAMGEYVYSSIVIERADPQ